MVAERAPPAHRRLAGAAGGMTTTAITATGSRARGSCIGRSRKRAAGCRRSSRECRCRPAPGSRAAASSRRPRRRARRLRRLAARAPRLRGRDRRRSHRAGRSPSSSPSSSRAAPTASPSSRRRATRSTRKLRPTARALRRHGARRGRPPLLASGARRPAAALLARRRSRSCRPSATRIADQSHFTSRHYWEVGATDADLRTGWLGRYLDRIGKTDNPLQGLSLDDTLAPALATAKVPVASISGARPVRLLQRTRLGRGRAADARGDRALGPPARGRRPAHRRQRRGAGRPPAPAADPFPVVDTATSPVAVSDSRTTRSRSGSQGSPRCSAAGLPLHCVALTAPGEYDTHADEPTALAQGLQLTSDSLLAFQRDLEARGLADRVLVHVWSEFGRRAAENGDAAPTTARPGSASSSARASTGQMVGEFPGLRSGLDSDGNVVGDLRLPRRLLGAARAVVRRRRRRRDPERRLVLAADARRSDRALHARTARPRPGGRAGVPLHPLPHQGDGPAA